MFDTVQLILRLTYYYSRVLGVFNFEINTKTGEARITSQSTIYAAVMNVAICCLLPLLTRSELIHILWKYAGLLHEYLFLVVMGMRIVCVIATLFSRWWQRRRIIRLVNAFRRLTVRKPQVIRMWRREVIKKFTSIIVTELLQMLGTIVTLRNLLTINLTLSILAVYMLAALVNVIISHFYFAMLNIHLHYVLLKQELRTVLNEIRSLENEHRRATYMNKCCCLADRLEDIAKRQSELQTLGGRMARVFGIQGLCISASSYVSSAYFVDVWISISNIYNVLDDQAELKQLMEQYTTFAPGLDKRLEAVFESFQLQLARNPLKISILGLYDMNKSTAMSMTNSIVTSSIVLIQYELENSLVKS
ncbi:putative gustatory receptor 59d [Drosophila innubila]|uniref:putative gustatory receptor 59d n=1 Tax=Drosophila innubila TaxID=198719 RepID=UPI00148C1679|nr:putative gustatory receptor 59d [Drosophila innubila]